MKNQRPEINVVSSWEIAKHDMMTYDYARWKRTDSSGRTYFCKMIDGQLYASSIDDTWILDYAINNKWKRLPDEVFKTEFELAFEIFLEEEKEKIESQNQTFELALKKARQPLPTDPDTMSRLTGGLTSDEMIEKMKFHNKMQKKHDKK